MTCTGAGKRRGDAGLDAKSQKQTHHDPEGERDQKVGTWPPELVQDLLAGGVDTVRLHRHFLPPPDERDEDGDRADRIDETLQVEREVSEIADRAIAEKISRCGVPHLVDGDGYQHCRHQQRRCDQEVAEICHSTGILLTLDTRRLLGVFLGLRLGPARRRAGGPPVVTRCS